MFNKKLKTRMDNLEKEMATLKEQVSKLPDCSERVRGEEPHTIIRENGAVGRTWPNYPIL